MLVQDIERLLREANYRVELARKESTTPSEFITLWFEDYSLFGFACVYESVEQLLKAWKWNQDAFLQANAPFLKAASQKAWNCYTVHLTEDNATPEQQQILFDIEENCASTRKIARAGIQTEAEVRRALYALIPVQNVIKLHQAVDDAGLGGRLHEWPAAATAALLGEGTAEDVVELLLEAE